MSELKISSKSKRYLKNRKNDIAGIRKCLKSRLELACSDVTNELLDKDHFIKFIYHNEKLNTMFYIYVRLSCCDDNDIELDDTVDKLVWSEIILKSIYRHNEYTSVVTNYDSLTEKYTASMVNNKKNIVRELLSAIVNNISILEHKHYLFQTSGFII